MWDVAVIGAGISGIVCAQRLHQAGYRTLVLEKSRGLGGRAATRRLEYSCADHGLRYLAAQGDLTQSLIEVLLADGVIKPWAGATYQWDIANRLKAIPPSQHYVAPQGMSSLGKALAVGLEIWRGQRVIALIDGHCWRLSLESLEGETSDVNAKAVIMAIPAPQAEALLAPLTVSQPNGIAPLRQVTFDPCISAIALYSDGLKPPESMNESWQSIQLLDHPDVSWISNETSKRAASGQAVVVVHSTPAFAIRHLESTALPEIGMQLLQAASAAAMSAIAHPTLLQVHRWRYATPKTPYSEPYLPISLPLPLVCCGDWAGGKTVETALRSGAMAAEYMNQQLENRPMPDSKIWRSQKQADISTPSL